MPTREATLVAYRAASDIAAKAAFLVITVLAARRLTQDAFGAFALGSTAGWLATVVSDAGIQVHLAREVARRPQSAAALLRRWTALRLQLAGAAAILVSAVCATRLVPHAGAVALFALVYLIGGLIEFLHHFYRGLGRSDLESTLTLVLRGVTLVSAGAALAWRPDPMALGIALLWPPVVVLLWSAGLAVKLANDASNASRVSHDVRGGRLQPAEAEMATSPPGRFWQDVAPIGAGIVLSALYFRVDVFLLEMWRGVETVAVYAAVFRLVEALRLFPAAVLAVALPAMCRATGARPLVPLAGGLTAFATVLSVALWLVSGWLVEGLYGPDYVSAVPVFRILLLAFPLMSLNYALTQQLVAWNRHRAFAGLCGAALAVNLGANARWIPSLGAAGAAWATLATEAALTVGCLAAVALHIRERAYVESGFSRTSPRPASPRPAEAGRHVPRAEES